MADWDCLEIDDDDVDEDVDIASFSVNTSVSPQHKEYGAAAAAAAVAACIADTENEHISTCIQNNGDSSSDRSPRHSLKHIYNSREHGRVEEQSDYSENDLDQSGSPKSGSMHHQITIPQSRIRDSQQKLPLQKGTRKGQEETAALQKVYADTQIDFSDDEIDPANQNVPEPNPSPVRRVDIRNTIVTDGLPHDHSKMTSSSQHRIIGRDTGHVSCLAKDTTLEAEHMQHRPSEPPSPNRARPFTSTAAPKAVRAAGMMHMSDCASVDILCVEDEDNDTDMTVTYRGGQTLDAVPRPDQTSQRRQSSPDGSEIPTTGTPLMGGVRLKKRKASARRIPGPVGQLSSRQNRSSVPRASQSNVSATQIAHEEASTAKNADPFTTKPWLRLCEYLGVKVFTNPPPTTASTPDSAPFKYTVDFVLKQGFYSRVPQLSVLLETLNRSSTQFPDGLARVRDPTGTMTATVHQKVLEKYRGTIAVGSALLLREISVFTPRLGTHYLNITPRNVCRIYPP